MTQYTTRWEVHYRNDQGQEVAYSEDGEMLFSYDDAADIAIRLEKENGRFYWVKSVRYAEAPT